MVTPRIINPITSNLSQSCSSRPLPSTLDLVEFPGRLCIAPGILPPNRQTHSVPPTYIRPHCPVMCDIIPNFSPQFTLDLQFRQRIQCSDRFCRWSRPNIRGRRIQKPMFRSREKGAWRSWRCSRRRKKRRQGCKLTLCELADASRIVNRISGHDTSGRMPPNPIKRG
jgi:hypothetical protein